MGDVRMSSVYMCMLGMCVSGILIFGMFGCWAVAVAVTVNVTVRARGAIIVVVGRQAGRREIGYGNETGKSERDRKDAEWRKRTSTRMRECEVAHAYGGVNWQKAGTGNIRDYTCTDG